MTDAVYQQRFDENRWTSKSGSVIALSEMNEHHIANAIAQLRFHEKICHGLEMPWLTKLCREMHLRCGPLPDCFCTHECRNDQYRAEADCDNCPVEEYCK